MFPHRLKQRGHGFIQLAGFGSIRQHAAHGPAFLDIVHFIKLRLIAKLAAQKMPQRQHAANGEAPVFTHAEILAPPEPLPAV